MSVERELRGRAKEYNESIKVSKKKINNKYYLLTKDNLILDINDYSLVGVYKEDGNIKYI